ncbi:unnamed protein product [Fusarium graminearum]|uniref:C2H2-type domain-containing protein n=1 Tax=Gibberella zeae TaxID=5518 RepID=A0A4E9EMW6_GIBZA|nr:unnamed protein product [Fusarium graminearum]CAF3609435.1 unnamed protein product [Fusarium graminearum]CAG1968887.1 unnamed protein product [Fusarium graminearum]CAG2002651.1 unnamed protein product [Fusarium graminearum]
MERGNNLFLSDVMFDPDIDTSSVPWSDLSLSPTEDALFADVYLGMGEDALTSFTSWDFLTIPDNGESSECIETQASLPRLQTHVSSDMLSPQTHEVPPTQCTPERPANVGNTPKRTKMKHGTRPCDLKRQKRKVDKPEKCHVCQKGHQWRRDLERHYCTHHPNEAAGMGFFMSMPVCRYCGQDFARRDHLTRHLRRKHGG